MMIVQTENMIDHSDEDEAVNVVEAPTEHYQDPATGAHFRYFDVYSKLLQLMDIQKDPETFTEALDDVLIQAKGDLDAPMTVITIAPKKDPVTEFKNVWLTKNTMNNNNAALCLKKTIQARPLIKPNKKSNNRLTQTKKPQPSIAITLAKCNSGPLNLSPPPCLYTDRLSNCKKTPFTLFSPKAGSNADEKVVKKPGKELASHKRPAQACVQQKNGFTSIIRRIRPDSSGKSGGFKNGEQVVAEGIELNDAKCHRKMASLKTLGNEEPQVKLKQRLVIKVRALQSKQRITTGAVYKRLTQEN